MVFHERIAVYFLSQNEVLTAAVSKAEELSFEEGGLDLRELIEKELVLCRGKIKEVADAEGERRAQVAKEEARQIAWKTHEMRMKREEKMMNRISQLKRQLKVTNCFYY